MTLHEKAYLVVSEDINDDATPDAVFEMEIGKQQTDELTKSYIMGERGQYIREVVNQVSGQAAGESATVDRRTGFWIDGGAGNWQETVEFETGLEDTRWGDGQSGTGPGNVTELDASGADVKKRSRADIFTNWMARTITDSNNPGLLYAGEWTDGRFEGTAGAFNRPMPVAVTNHNISTDVDRPSGLRGSVTVAHLLPFPDASEVPSWIEGGASDFLDGIEATLSEIPDE